MTRATELLFEEACQLPDEELDRLIGLLLGARAPGPDADDPHFLDEVLRRSAEMASGEEAGIPWETVRRTLRSRIEGHASNVVA